jgi:hypothetical protein
MMPQPGATTGCRECMHFENSPAALEAALPGLTSFGSAHAAVRAEDGICAFHARYVAADCSCSAARRRAVIAAPPAPFTPERNPSAKCAP